MNSRPSDRREPPMTRTLQRVADPPVRRGVPAHLTPIGEPPAAGSLDELGRARIRRLLSGYLGEFPTLDAHVDLLDTRGAWYAEQALGAWDTHKGHRYTLGRRTLVTVRAATAPEIAAFDALLTAWPQGQLNRFVFAYASLENVLERRFTALPPIDA